MSDASHPGDPTRSRGRWSRYVRDLTERPGWSVARLARESGVHRSTIFRWINGEVQNVSMVNVRLVAKAAGEPENAAFQAAGELLLDDDNDPERRRHVAVRIKAAREAAGLTLEELANRARISMTTLGAIERGDAGWVHASTYDAIDAALRGERQPTDRVDYIAEWEKSIIDEIWAHPTLPVEVKEELTARARARAAEARVVEDRLRRTA